MGGEGGKVRVVDVELHSSVASGYSVKIKLLSPMLRNMPRVQRLGIPKDSLQV